MVRFHFCRIPLLFLFTSFSFNWIFYQKYNLEKYGVTGWDWVLNRFIQHGIAAGLLCFLFYNYISSSEVLIITHNVNRPDFIELQHKTFKKFLHDSYEFVVFNDAQTPSMVNQIDAACEACGIRNFHLPQINRSVNSCSGRHSEAIMYSLQKIGLKYDGIVMMIDCDMFLIKDFSVVDFLRDFDIAGLYQLSSDQKCNYLFAGLIFFNMNNLPNKATMNLSDGYINGARVDTGGNIYYYLKANPSVKTLYFQDKFRFFLDKDLRIWIEEPGCFNVRKYLRCGECKTSKKECFHNTRILQEKDFSAKIIACVSAKTLPYNSEFILKDTFFHYRAASYDIAASNKPYLLKNFIEGILDSQNSDFNNIQL